MPSDGVFGVPTAPELSTPGGLEATHPRVAGYGSLLARNTLWNLFGGAAPFAIAVFSIPILIHHLGVDRYGVIALASLVIGYFGLFDFGLGRAVTKLVADAVGAGDERQIPAIAWTSLFLMALFGTCGAVTMWALSPWLVDRMLTIPRLLQPETLGAFRVLAVSLPFVITAGNLAGILAGAQRFDLINLVRVPLGSFTFLGPLMVLPFSCSVLWIVAALVVGRLVGWLVLLLLCLRVFPEIRDEIRMSRALMRPLLNFGAWVTVTGVSAPVLENIGRFMLGALVSTAAVTYYAVPYQVVTRLLIIPTALSGVLFPAFSSAFVQRQQRILFLFERAVVYVFIALFPAVLVIITFAPEGLDMWLGAGFARQSTWAVRWLALGVFANGFAYLAFALVQAANRPDLTGKLHIVEAPLQILLLWLMLPRYKVTGAAVAWAISIWADAVILCLLAAWLVPGIRRVIVRTGLAIGLSVCILAGGLLSMSIVMKLSFVGLILISFAVLTWFKLLLPIEKANIYDVLRQPTRAIGSMIRFDAGE